MLSRVSLLVGLLHTVLLAASTEIGNRSLISRILDTNNGRNGRFMPLDLMLDSTSLAYTLTKKKKDESSTSDGIFGAKTKNQRKFVQSSKNKSSKVDPYRWRLRRRKLVPQMSKNCTITETCTLSKLEHRQKQTAKFQYFQPQKRHRVRKPLKIRPCRNDCVMKQHTNQTAEESIHSKENHISSRNNLFENSNVVKLNDSKQNRFNSRQVEIQSVRLLANKTTISSVVLPNTDLETIVTTQKSLKSVGERLQTDILMNHYNSDKNLSIKDVKLFAQLTNQLSVSPSDLIRLLHLAKLMKKQPTKKVPTVNNVVQQSFNKHTTQTPKTLVNKSGVLSLEDLTTNDQEQEVMNTISTPKIQIELFRKSSNRLRSNTPKFLDVQEVNIKASYSTVSPVVMDSEKLVNRRSFQRFRNKTEGILSNDDKKVGHMSSFKKNIDKDEQGHSRKMTTQKQLKREEDPVLSAFPSDKDIPGYTEPTSFDIYHKYKTRKDEKKIASKLHFLSRLERKNLDNVDDYDLRRPLYRNQIIPKHLKHVPNNKQVSTQDNSLNENKVPFTVRSVKSIVPHTFIKQTVFDSNKNVGFNLNKNVVFNSNENAGIQVFDPKQYDESPSSIENDRHIELKKEVMPYLEKIPQLFPGQHDDRPQLAAATVRTTVKSHAMFDDEDMEIPWGMTKIKNFEKNPFQNNIKETIGYGDLEIKMPSNGKKLPDRPLDLATIFRDLPDLSLHPQYPSYSDKSAPFGKHYLKNPFGSDFIRLEIDRNRFKHNKSAAGIMHIPLKVHGYPDISKSNDVNFHNDIKLKNNIIPPQQKSQWQRRRPATTASLPPVRNVFKDRLSVRRLHVKEVVAKNSSTKIKLQPDSKLKQKKSLVRMALNNIPGKLFLDLPTFMTKLMSTHAVTWAANLWPRRERNEAAS